RTRWAHRRGVDAVPTAGNSVRHPWAGLGHHSHAILPDPVHHRLHHGRAELRGDGAAGAHARHDVDAFALDGVGHFHGHRYGVAGIPGTARRLGDAAARPPVGDELLYAHTCGDGRTDEVSRRQSHPVPAPIL